jgi:predicted ATP-grasp superfamily ATP-dependent carboligase|tara:strand:- start:52 stop:255 length:204 start_codon:yes stop_codon:yes gene_type:complete
MDVNLTKDQKVFVEEYQRILNKLADIQFQVDDLQVEAKKYIKELNDLREKERSLFPDQEIIDEETNG